MESIEEYLVYLFKGHTYIHIDLRVIFANQPKTNDFPFRLLLAIVLMGAVSHDMMLVEIRQVICNH